MASVPFLVEKLGPDARIEIQVAWGADVTAAYSSWTWTSISGDVRIKDGVSIKQGRADEAAKAQPATCTLVLDNSTGAYSLGGQSPNWPHVVKNTPVRIMVDHDGNGTFSVLFIGYADSWSPKWNKAATVAEVHLTASGILRRLQQRTAPVLSSLRRRLSSESNVVAYWPLEEGKLATAGASAIEGHPPLTVLNTVEFAANTDAFAATVQMPVLKLGGLWGLVPNYTVTAGQQFRCLFSFPDNGSGMAIEGNVAHLQMGSSSFSAIEVRYLANGSLRIMGTSRSGATTTTLFNPAITFAVDGKDLRLYIELAQVGPDTTWRVGIQTPGAGGFFAGGTVAGATMGRIEAVRLGNDSNHNGLAVGHPVVQNAVTSIFDDAQELDAFEGETSWVRFSRLCTENGLEKGITTDGTAFDQVTDKMGEQRPLALLTLLEQVQEVDRGIVYDGRTQGGLNFRTRRAIESGAASLTVDVGADKLAGILEPVDDDQSLLNKAVVQRVDGATAVFEDVNGPLGTSSVGTYDSSLTIPVASDAAVLQYASWAVALGTVEGYRYPSVELDLAATPELIPAFMGLTPGSRVDLVNVAATATQHPRETIRLLVQGFEQTLTPFSWNVTLNCTPFDPWYIGRTANADGTPVSPNPDADTMHMDTDGSTLSAAAAIGATSLSVATTTGPRWTTVAADFPFDIEVGGIVVTVTAISGAGSPQTFTVTGVTKALAAGLDVRLHAPLVLGL